MAGRKLRVFVDGGHLPHNRVSERGMEGTDGSKDGGQFVMPPGNGGELSVPRDVKKAFHFVDPTFRSPG